MTITSFPADLWRFRLDLWNLNHVKCQILTSKKLQQCIWALFITSNNTFHILFVMYYDKNRNPQKSSIWVFLSSSTCPFLKCFFCNKIPRNYYRKNSRADSREWRVYFWHVCFNWHSLLITVVPFQGYFLIAISRAVIYCFLFTCFFSIYQIFSSASFPLCSYLNSYENVTRFALQARQFLEKKHNFILIHWPFKIRGM